MRNKPYLDCNKKYVGETSRSPQKTNLQVHDIFKKKRNINNSLVKHNLKTNPKL